MNTVITIGRRFGTGGHEIGEKLADHYGIKCYDREIISRAAKDSGLCEEILEHHDERPTSSFLYNLVMDAYSFGNHTGAYMDMPISHKVFIAQFDAIKQLADEGPCIIVGRCADYALAERKNLLRIFIDADMECRVKRICEKYDLSEGKAKERISRTDKERSSYYNYYSTAKWGHASTYDMCINSSRLGIDGTVKVLTEFIDAFDATL